MNRRATNTHVKDKGYSIQKNSPQNITRKTNHSKYYNFFVDTVYDDFYYLDCSTDDERMLLCTKKYLKQFDSLNKNIFFSFNMHPKGMTKKHFIALEKYHNSLTKYYKDNIKVITFQQAAELIQKRE